jgi:uncharacterized metal-binding protein
MIDKTQELIWELQNELNTLDNAYVVGDYKLTLSNLGMNVQNMNEDQLKQEYKKVVMRIFEIQSLLNVDNSN